MADDDYNEDFEAYDDDFEDADAHTQAPASTHTQGKPQAVSGPASVNATVTAAGASKVSSASNGAASAAGSAGKTAASTRGSVAVESRHPAVTQTSVGTAFEKAPSVGHTATQKPRPLPADVVLESEGAELLFAAPPASVLDRFIERQRTGAIKHGFAQAPVERVTVSTQSERNERADAAAQAPDDLGAIGRGATPLALDSALLAAATGAAGPKALAQAQATVSQAMLAAMDARGVAFVKSAGLLMEALCEENVASGDAPPVVGDATSRMVLSKAGPTIVPVPSCALFAGRELLASVASPVRPQELAVALGPMSVSLPDGGGSSASTIFPAYRAAHLIVLFEGKSIRYVLLSWGTPTCMTYSADGLMFVAGTSGGGLFAWALTEPAWLHQTVFGTASSAGASGGGTRAEMSIDSGLRMPSYSTHAPERASVMTDDAGAPRSRLPIRAIAEVARRRTPILEGESFALGAQSVMRTSDRLHMIARHGLQALLEPETADGEIPSAAIGDVATVSGSQAGSSTYQFMSVDEGGTADVWVVVHVAGSATSGAVGSATTHLIDDSDLGRSVTSSIRLIRASSTPQLPAAVSKSPSQPAQISCVDLHPTNLDRVLLGRTDGCISHSSRSGQRLAPSTFFVPAESAALVSAVTCVRYHTALPAFFLAAFDNGCVALFKDTQNIPLRIWRTPWTREKTASGASQPFQSAVLWVDWLPTRGSAFVAIDEHGWWAVFDLCVSVAQPLVVQRAQPTFSTAAEGRAAAAGGAEAAPAPVGATVSGGGPLARHATSLVIAFSNKNCVSIALDRKFCIPRANELEEMRSLVERL